MSKNVIFVLMYHRHKPSDHSYKVKRFGYFNPFVLYSTKKSTDYEPNGSTHCQI
jgi:hypothetical protein